MYLFERKIRRLIKFETRCRRCNSMKSSLFFIRRNIVTVRHALGRFSTSHLSTDLWTATWPRYGRYTSVHSRFNPLSSTGNSRVLLSLGCETRLRDGLSGTLVSRFYAFALPWANTNINNRSRNPNCPGSSLNDFVRRSRIATTFWSLTHGSCNVGFRISHVLFIVQHIVLYVFQCWFNDDKWTNIIYA